jgi:hypothetical protein
MIAYRYDDDGCYRGTVTLYESPREPGVYPMPLNATLLAPDTSSDIFIDGAWITPDTTRTPDDAYSEKLAEVTSGFDTAISMPFSIDGLTFDNGMTSILKIFLAIEKSEKNGELTRTLYESDETPHEFTIEEGRAIAVAIGDDYDKKDAMMRAYKKALANIMASAQTDEDKVTNIDAINVSYELTEEV